MEKLEVQINDLTYQILLPAVTVALPLATRALTIFGPMAGLFADMKTVIDPDAPMEKRLEAVLGRFGSLISQLDPKGVNELLMDAVGVSGLCCEGQSISSQLNFERHFSQHRSDVFQVMLWCLWEIASPFLPASLTSIPQAMMSRAGEAFRSQMDGQSTTG